MAHVLTTNHKTTQNPRRNTHTPPPPPCFVCVVCSRLVCFYNSKIIFLTHLAASLNDREKRKEEIGFSLSPLPRPVIACCIYHPVPCSVSANVTMDQSKELENSPVISEMNPQTSVDIHFVLFWLPPSNHGCVPPCWATF